MNEKKHKLSFNDGYTWKVITIEFHIDSDVSEWKNVFKTIMTFATFHPDALEFLDDCDE